MTARTDRIAKLTNVIPQMIAANEPNKAARMSEKLASFEAMTDDRYDALMDLNRQILATGVLPSGLQLRA